MLKRITAGALSFLFLVAGMWLPLGDFSLIKDLPTMYHSYEKLASADEVGVVDFIGDYLLAGKALLGHNKNDKPESPNTSVQFQHAVASCNFVNSTFQLPYISIKDLKIQNIFPNKLVPTTEFHPELFRPPLA